jgi:hypothetical protein
MGKRKAGQPAPWIDLWGKPTWDNPYGQLPPNPEFTARKRRPRRRDKNGHEAAEGATAAAANEAVVEQSTEHEVPTAPTPWRRQPASGTTA